MAITSSAKKAARSSAKKRIFNLRRASAFQNATKSFRQALLAKDVKGAEKLLPSIYKAIDKAYKNGIIKANTAARKKSSFAIAIAKLRA